MLLLKHNGVSYLWQDIFSEFSVLLLLMSNHGDFCDKQAFMYFSYLCYFFIYFRGGGGGGVFFLEGF